MEDQEPGVVRLSDPRADPAETAVMRHYGDKTMLVIPLVYQGQSVGFLEVYDHVRDRRFTRQELRLACALAGLATTALHNARVFAELSRCQADATRVHGALDEVVAGLPTLAAARTVDELLRETALLACRSLGGLGATAAWGDATAQAGAHATAQAGAHATAQTGAHATAQAGDGVVAGEATRVVGVAPAGSHALEVRVALRHPGGDVEAGLARLIAASAAQAILRFEAAAVPQ